jgi:hypothetical protein
MGIGRIRQPDFTHLSYNFMPVATPNAKTPKPGPGRPALLYCAALVVWLWETARAAVQSITIDEAHTYWAFVARPWPTHWNPAANNHVLNSMLMRLAVALFGVSHLTLRAPALLGAAIYLGSAVVLVRAIAARPVARLALFVCLAGNPFVLDFLAAARGYSLALGFLMAAVAIAAVQHLQGPGGGGSPQRSLVAASLCLGLSFAANFSFGLVDACAAAMICLWALYDRPRGRGSWEAVRMVAACGAPALGAALFFGAPALLNWPGGELWFGAQSVPDTFRSVVRDSFYEPNRFLLNPYLVGFLDRWHHLIPLLLGAAVLWHAVAALAGRRTRESGELRRAASLPVFLLAVLAAALGAHWAMHRWWHIPLPMGRTALFFVPLATLAAGAAAGLPGVSRMAQASRRAATAMLVVLACYFLCCLRLTYFKDWKFDADARAAYFTVAYYSRTYRVTDVSANWRYVAVLNFYRNLYGARIDEPELVEHYDMGRRMFVLYGPDDREFIEANGLKVVYRGERSGVVVAIRPEVEAAAPCPPG